MNNVLIWAYCPKGKEAKERLEEFSDSINVVGYIDMNPKKWRKGNGDSPLVLGIDAAMVLYLKKQIDKIIVPSFYNRNLFLSIIRTVARYDIAKEDIWVPTIEFFNGESDDYATPWYNLSQIDYVEYAITDACNLNCKRCARFAPLIKTVEFDFDKFTKDFLQLKKYIKHINMIRLLGGEPLLEPNLDKYFDFIRELYPNSEICMVTNGILLLKLPKHIEDSIIKNNITIHVTVYPPMFAQEKRIKRIIKEIGVKSVVTRCEMFYKSFDLSSDDNIKQKKEYCIQGCISLRNGRLYPCATSACFDIFDNEFDTKKTYYKGIDLYSEGLTAESIKKELDRANITCKYCNFKKLYLWEQQGSEIEVGDWVINE